MSIEGTYYESPTFYDLRDLKYFVTLCDNRSPVYLFKVEREVYYPESEETRLEFVYELKPLKTPEFASDYVIQTFMDSSEAEGFCEHYNLTFLGFDEGEPYDIN